MLMKSGLQEQEVQWAKETEEEPKKDDLTNSWAGLRNVKLFTQTFAHFLCSSVNCQRMFKHSNSSVSFLHNMDILYIRDISQLIFWVPINNGNSETNAEEVVDEVVEAEVLVLGAGRDVFFAILVAICDNF